MARKSPDHQVVYFIRSGRRGPVKIGITDGSAKWRMAELQVGNPEKLYLLGVCPGYRELEQQLHQRLAKHRIRGEWFKPTQEVMDALKETVSFAPQDTDFHCHVTSQQAINCINCGSLLGSRWAWAYDPEKDENRMCGACEEFASLRDAGGDPFAEVV